VTVWRLTSKGMKMKNALRNGEYRRGLGSRVVHNRDLVRASTGELFRLRGSCLAGEDQADANVSYVCRGLVGRSGSPPGPRVAFIGLMLQSLRCSGWE